MQNYLIVYLMFCHFIADFVLQSDWMAKEKSKSNIALLTHCLVYGFTIGIMTLNPTFGVLSFVIHFPVDYVTSRINSKLWEKKDVHWFFVSIGFDQWLHFVTLIILFTLLH